MSLENIRPYFKERMKNLGLKEWKQAFNTSDIPENIIGSQYNAVLAPLSQFKFNQQALDIKVPVNLKCWVKAYKEHMVAYDSAVALAADIIREVLNPRNRLSQTNGIKTINIGSGGIEQFAPDNDNIMVVNFQFIVDLTMDVCPSP